MLGICYACYVQHAFEHHRRSLCFLFEYKNSSCIGLAWVYVEWSSDSSILFIVPKSRWFSDRLKATWRELHQQLGKVLDNLGSTWHQHECGEEMHSLQEGITSTGCEPYFLNLKSLRSSFWSRCAAHLDKVNLASAFARQCCQLGNFLWNHSVAELG